MDEVQRGKLSGAAHSLEVAAQQLGQRANIYQYELARHTGITVDIAWTELDLAMGAVRLAIAELERAHDA